MTSTPLRSSFSSKRRPCATILSTCTCPESSAEWRKLGLLPWRTCSGRHEARPPCGRAARVRPRSMTVGVHRPGPLPAGLGRRKGRRVPWRTRSMGDAMEGKEITPAAPAAQGLSKQEHCQSVRTGTQEANPDEVDETFAPEIASVTNAGSPGNIAKGTIVEDGPAPEITFQHGQAPRRGRHRHPGL